MARLLCLLTVLVAVVASPCLVSAYDGKAAVAKIKAALTKAKFNAYATQLANSNFDKSLAEILPKYKITLLVPTDGAFASMKDFAKIKANKKKMFQVFAYNMIGDLQTYTGLQKMSKGKTFATGQAKQILQLMKVGKDLVVFSNPGKMVGAKITKPAFYKDAQVIMHGVTGALAPPQFV